MTARNETQSRLPVPLAAAARREDRSERARPDVRFAAQLLGAGGERRGLKGGPPVLEAARSAYLHAQWSGTEDRRLPSGVRARSRV